MLLSAARRACSPRTGGMLLQHARRFMLPVFQKALPQRGMAAQEERRSVQ